MAETLLKLGAQDAGTRLSREEFAEADLEPPYRYERVDGRLVVMAPAGAGHRQPVRPLVRDLYYYWKVRPEIVDFIDVEGWTAVGEDTDRIPDASVYLNGPASGTDVPVRVPDLIFEFVSGERADQQRDYIHKRAEYHAIGVQEYVIVDRFKQQVLALSWAHGDFTEKTFGPRDVYTTPMMPGLEIGLGEVFADA